MFTGIITEIGTIKSTAQVSTHLRLTIHAPKTASETAPGESININGACQTVVDISGETFSVDTIPETLKKTTLGELNVENQVNLEQAMRPTDRLGGHIVTGHIDCVGAVREIRKQSSTIEIKVAFPHEFRELVVSQGSVALNGISLTVADLRPDEFTVAIIPTTWKTTTLPELRPGSRVNLEFDIIGKYIARFLTHRKTDTKINEQMLRELGY